MRLKENLTETEEPKISYPIPFPLKIIGLNEPDFEDFAIEIVRRHVPELLEENIVGKLSHGDKYRSISFQFIAESRTQVDALYAELSTHKRVLMIL
jgi:putative lipoic acid-binding regulatory protein